MDRQNHPLSSAMTRLIAIGILLSFILISPSALGQQVNPSQAEWRATVKCDSLPVYSHMSTNSRIVKFLKSGSTVTIDLEIVGSDGAWSLVREQGQRVRLGYVQSECLDGERPISHATWQPPPPAVRPSQS